MLFKMLFDAKSHEKASKCGIKPAKIASKKHQKALKSIKKHFEKHLQSIKSLLKAV